MVKCPVCGEIFDSFKPYGANLRPNACCPNCESLDRHRVLWKFIEKTSIIDKKYPKKILDIAPTKGIKQKLLEFDNLTYISIDLNSPLADLKMDIQELKFPDGIFDLVICYHVLEHVMDDFKAIKEIYRCLKPGGLALISVPYRKDRIETIEGRSIKDPKERKRIFGQEDHFRYYGLDFKYKLESAGFVVQVVGIKNFFTKEEISYYKLEDNDIYLAIKPNKYKKIIATGKNQYKIEGSDFNFIDIRELSQSSDLNNRDVMIKKPKEMAENYRDFFSSKRIETLLEFGVAEGGSCVLFNQLFELRKYIGIDIKHSEKALKIIEEKNLKDRTFFYFLISQSDKVKIRQIIEKHFSDDQIDLIIDDASHLFEHTLGSFEASFPFLRPYGFYVIEDWGWCHYMGFENHPFVREKQKSLTNLLALLIMLQASNPQLIRKIYIESPSLIIIEKGEYVVKDPSSFSIRDYIRINSVESLFIFNLSDFLK